MKQLFFNFLLMTVNNYIAYYHYQDDLLTNTDTETNDLHRLKSSDELFDFDGYLKWQDERADELGSSNAFIREFVGTQTFHEFIEHSYRGLTSSNIEKLLH